MEPLAHSLFGASLAHLAGRSDEGAAERRTLLLAGVVAANVPDVDALAYLAGSDFALGFRRGITHGVPAMALWPVILTVLFASWRRRGRDPAPASPGGRLAAVITLACWSHPTLDWLNNYGVRLLMPFDRDWFYGDLVFIVDPWMWLLLGGGLALGSAADGRDGGPPIRWRWMVLATVCAVAVAAAPTPVWARGLWSVAFVVLGLAAFRRRGGSWSRVPVAVGVTLVVLYVASLWGVERAGRSRVAAAIRGQAPLVGTGSRDLMVGPLPMDPFTWQVVARVDEQYLVGSYRRSGGLDVTEWIEAEEAAAGRPLGAVDAAWAAPEVVGFAEWARFPFHRVVEESEGRFVYLLDARYATAPTTLFGGVRVAAPSQE